MNVYPVPESLKDHYRGAGYALAASVGGQLVALRYIESLAPEIDDELFEGGQIARAAVRHWIASDAAGPAVREMQALGEVHVGMCSSWEFVEL